MASTHFTLQESGDYLVVEFQSASMMDAVVLEQVKQEMYKLIDEQDRRKIILDFHRVQFLSSQAIGIILGMHAKLKALKHSDLVLRGICGRLMELIKITRLDRILTIKPT